MHALKGVVVAGAIGAAGLLAVVATRPAAATSITLNHELIGPMSQESCLARARVSLEAAGLTLLSVSSTVAFAETGQYVVALDCMAQQGVIVVSAAGPDVAQTDPIVTRVLDAWRGAGGTAAPIK